MPTLSADAYQELILEADLGEISHFVWIAGKVKSYQWKLPSEIKFEILDEGFSQRMEASALSDIAYFLFNFHYIRRPDLCYRFAQKLEQNAHLVTAKLKAAKVAEIDLFLWNFWTCFPAGKTPALLHSLHFLAILEDGQSQLWEDLESALGVLGTFNHIEEELPFAAIPRDLHKTARRLCLQEAEKASHRLIRTCANNLYFSGKEKKKIEDALGKIDMTLDIPNEKIAIEHLSKRLACQRE